MHIYSLLSSMQLHNPDFEASTSSQQQQQQYQQQWQEQNQSIKTSAQSATIRSSDIEPIFLTKAKYLVAGILIITVGIFYSLEQIYKSGANNGQYMTESKKDNSYRSLSAEELQLIIAQMRRRPSHKLEPVQGKLRATPQAYFAYNLHLQPTNNTLLQAQHHHFAKTYSTPKYHKQQLPICIVSTGRNLLYQYRYVTYLDSLARQDYSNYRVVVVDDASNDGTVEAMKGYLERDQMTGLKERMRILQNLQRKYALFNRHLAITNYCSENDIIVQLDSDDQFIGAQVLSTLNAIYASDPATWIMYSSYIHWSPTHGQPTQGISQKIPTKILQQGTYRQSTQWYTSATRTFLRKLYMKLDERDFIDKSSNSKQFYKWTSDLFVHYSLVQMAGARHYRYVHEVFYYYNLQHNQYMGQQKAISRLNSLAIPRYKQLDSLDDPPQRYPLEDISWIQFQKQNIRQKYKKQTNN